MAEMKTRSVKILQEARAGVCAVTVYIVFAFYLTFTETCGLAAALVPAILQSRQFHKGIPNDEIVEGEPLAPLNATLALLEEAGFQIGSYEEAGRTVDNETLIHMDKMTVRWGRLATYEDAAALSVRLNDLVLDTGACTPDVTRRRCVPFTSATKEALRDFHHRLPEVCRNASEYSVASIFKKCLRIYKYASSFHIAASNLAYEHGTECTYDFIKMRSWALDTGRLDKHRDDMQEHGLTCRLPMGMEFTHGFLMEKRMEVYNEWRSLLRPQLRCANGFAEPGSFVKYKTSHGSVEVGVHSIVTYCKDKGYNSKVCWQSVTELLGPVMGKNTTAMEAFSHPELYAFGQEVVDQAYAGTLDFSRAAAKFSRLSEEYSAGSWDSWVAVFASGDEIETRVLGPSSFQVIRDALLKSGIVPPEWVKKKDCVCKNATTGEILFEEEGVLHKIRRNSYVHTTTLWRRLPNIITAPLQPLFIIFAPAMAAHSTHRHSILGAAFLIFVAATWLLATAVTSNYGGACELRLLRLFDAPAMTLFLQTQERASMGTTAVMLVQSVVWLLSHAGLANTGQMPNRLKNMIARSGLLVVFVVGWSFMTSPGSCALELNLRQMDIFGPLVVAMLGVVLIFTRIGTPSRSLWLKFDYEDIAGDMVGLALGKKLFGHEFYVTVKRGPILLKYGFGDDIDIATVEEFRGAYTPDSFFVRCMKYHICERSSQSPRRKAELEDLANTFIKLHARQPRAPRRKLEGESGSQPAEFASSTQDIGGSDQDIVGSEVNERSCNSSCIVSVDCSDAPADFSPNFVEKRQSKGRFSARFASRASAKSTAPQQGDRRAFVVFEV